MLNMEQKMETEALLNLEPNVELLEQKIDRRSGIDARTKVNLRNVENPKVKIPRTVPVVPVVMAESGEEEDMGGGEGEEEEGDCDKNGGWDGEEKGSIEGEVRDEVDGNAEGGEDGREGGENDGMGKGRGRKRASKDKKGGKAVNIPSIEYPVSMQKDTVTLCLYIYIHTHTHCLYTHVLFSVSLFQKMFVNDSFHKLSSHYEWPIPSCRATQHTRTGFYCQYSFIQLLSGVNTHLYLIIKRSNNIFYQLFSGLHNDKLQILNRCR